MENLLKLNSNEKRELFEESARRFHGIPAILIEKDFWVCWTLQQVFSLEELRNQIIFKGGTSLSKVYKVIDRFSEDIDLTMSPALIGIADDQQPKTASGRKERDRRLVALKQAAETTVRTTILDAITKQFSSLLGRLNLEWQLTLDEKDPQTILFYYPRILNYGKGYGKGPYGAGAYGEGEPGYIRPMVRIEFGARGEQWPAETSDIKPYVAEMFPEVFSQPIVSVKNLAIERTYWEKITLLHAEHYREKGKSPLPRLSRHYYDVYKLDQAGITNKAFSKKDLLKAVVEHKKIYFSSAWASYDTAQLGSMKVLPNPERIRDLKKDYGAMKEMFFGDSPDFDTLIESLGRLETRLNEHA